VQRAPFLRDKVLKQGKWGVSHTRVPTESRPGHVALIAGFYEDVSSVTKGWKTNAVEFDSFFNQSRHTWSYGSPDILPMFSLGALDPFKIETVMYEAKFEDFAKDEASQLDTWVFDKFKELFENAKRNSTLSDMLHQDKIVFFLHLLGLDTNGHGNRPYSAAYLENIQVVDKGLEEVEKMMNYFYENDGKTVFVMTADHGMNNRGAHGDGDPQNTETPLILWGAGIQTAKKLTVPEHNEQSKIWNLDNIERNDVNQADIAPLMSTLIGVPFPMNSEGSLPIKYLENTDEYKSRAVFQNALAILAQYEMKANRKQRSEVIFFQPFEPLKDYENLLDGIKLLIKQKNYILAQEKSFVLINLAIEGLRYYQTYDWLLLRTIVSLGYSGWIIYSSTFIIRMYSGEKINTSGKTLTKFIILTIFCLLSTVLYFKESPVSYYGYVFFPVVFWCRIFEDSTYLKKKLISGSDMKTFKHLLVYIGTLEMLVVSYFYRELLTVCLLVMGFLWPLSLDSLFCDRHVLLLRAWRGLCLITSVFTLLSVELEESLFMM
jgi:phosphatidylinositol glycan class N